MIPHENERDLKEVPDNIKENLDIRPVKWIDEVLAIALERMPEPMTDEPTWMAHCRSQPAMILNLIRVT